jgi:TolB-like protein
MSTASDIFLSYNREDQAAAKRFAEGFEAAGLSVWWDVTLRSGEAYDEVTEEALRTAKAVVVLWSTKSVVSRWVRAEATLADRKRTLVPARIEPCDLPIMFELTQTAELSNWQGDAGDPTWSAFLIDVRRMVGTQASSPPAAVQSAVKPRSRGVRASIAVLPFINRSGLAEDDIFADGMVDDLTTALSLTRKMKVIASSATAAYRTGPRDLNRIGHDLNVRYLLEGNIRRVGDGLRVTAQLVEAAEGDILWTQKFDRNLAQIAALQEELVTEVAAHLGVQVELAEIENALRKPDDLTAWEAVLRAEVGLSRQTEAGAVSALAEARRAIEIEPDYDVAHAVMVIALGMLRDFCIEDDAALTQQLQEAVSELQQIDSSDPVVLARLACGLVYLGRYQEALPIAEQAVAINPNIELPHMVLGTVLINFGRSNEAIPELRAAETIAPNGIWFFASLSIRSMALLDADQFEQSLEAVEMSLRVRPIAAGKLHKMICLAKLGRWGEARCCMYEVRQTMTGTSFEKLEHLARSHFGSFWRRLDEFVAILRRLWEESDGTP